MRKFLATAMTVVLMTVSGSTAADAATVAQFFPQPGDPAFNGFTLSDDEGLPFLTAFRRFGGEKALGRPISHRFVWHGFVSQLTERAMLQWDPASKRVRLANTTDLMSEAGLDQWLEENWAVPKPSTPPVEAGSGGDAAARLAWLDADASFREAYHAAPDPKTLYGLPTSPVTAIGDLQAVRLQRAVFHRAADDPSAATVVAVTGTMLADSGLFPPDVTTPQPAPENTAAPAPPEPVSTPATPPLVGVATWYGDYFHGRVMRNGERYNMWDPATIACNELPLGTMVRVTHRGTGESIVARVTDTGAFRRPIVADLSRAGFALLANNAVGVIPVSIEVLS